MSGRLGFDFSFSSAKPRPRGGGQRLRLLLLADFAGEALPPFKIRKVDIDNLDATVAATAPHVTLALEGGLPAGCGFACMEDFHPDSLMERIPHLRDLAATRAQLQNPATFAATAARLMGTVAASPGAPAEPTSLLSSLLGGEVRQATPVAQPTQAAEAWLHTLLRETVSPHVVPAAGAEQATLVAAVEASLAEGLRRVLHAPAFQRVEAAWRGLERLVASVPPESGVELWIGAASPQVILEDLRRHRTQPDEPEASWLAGALLGPEAPSFSCVLVDEVYGHTDDALSDLGSLAEVVARAGATLLAGGAPALAGWQAPLALHPVAILPGQREPALADVLRRLRESPIAPHVGLVLPRLLLRLPYGPRRNEVHAFAFDELGGPGPPDPARLLFGSGAWAAGEALATAFAEDPEAMPLGEAGRVESVPVFTYQDAQGEKVLHPASEAWLTESQAQAVLEGGLMPLQCHRQLAEASLLRLQSLASPATALDVRPV